MLEILVRNAEVWITFDLILETEIYIISHPETSEHFAPIGVNVAIAFP